MRASLLLLLLLPACANYVDMYSNKYTSVGGDADVTFPGGGHLTHSHTASFQHFTQAGVAIIGGAVTAAASKANTASNNATTLAGQKESDTAALTLQQEKDAAAAALAHTTQQNAARAAGVPPL